MKYFQLAAVLLASASLAQAGGPRLRTAAVLVREVTGIQRLKEAARSAKAETAKTAAPPAATDYARADSLQRATSALEQAYAGVLTGATAENVAAFLAARAAFNGELQHVSPQVRQAVGPTIAAWVEATAKKASLPAFARMLAAEARTRITKADGLLGEKYALREQILGADNPDDAVAAAGSYAYVARELEAAVVRAAEGYAAFEASPARELCVQAILAESDTEAATVFKRLHDDLAKLNEGAAKHALITRSQLNSFPFRQYIGQLETILGLNEESLRTPM